MPKTDRTGNYSLIHSLERLKERYNIVISDKEFFALNAQIKEFIMVDNSENSFALLYDVNKENDKTLFIIKIKDFHGVEVWCVYVDKRDTITTFLPPISGKKKSKKFI